MKGRGARSLWVILAVFMTPGLLALTAPAGFGSGTPDGGGGGLLSGGGHHLNGHGSAVSGGGEDGGEAQRGPSSRETGGPQDAANGNPAGDGVWETVGDWVVEDGDALLYENITIMLNGDLTVSSGGKLTLSNVMLKANISFDGEFGIEVLGGGGLDILNGSHITVPAAAGANAMLVYRPLSAGLIEDSTISRMGYNMGGESVGPRIESSGVSVLDSLMTGNFDGLHVHGASPLIDNVTFSGNNIGLYIASGASPTVQDCTIADNDYGVHITNSSSPQISGCSITGTNKSAMNIGRNCNPDISHCNMDGFGWRGIFVAHDSSPILRDLDIAGSALYSNDQGIVVNSSSPQIRYCAISNVETGISLSSGSNAGIRDCVVDHPGTVGVISSDSSLSLTRVTVDGAGGTGMHIDGGDAHVRDCRVLNSSLHGMVLENGTCDVNGTSALGNQGWGLYALNISASSGLGRVTGQEAGFISNGMGDLIRDVYFRIRCLDPFGEPLPGFDVTVTERTGYQVCGPVDRPLATGTDGWTGKFNLTVSRTPAGAATAFDPNPFTFHASAGIPSVLANTTTTDVTGYGELVLELEYVTSPYVGINTTMGHEITERFGGLLEENASAPLAEGDLLVLNATLERWDYPEYPGPVDVGWNLTVDGGEATNGITQVEEPGNHTLLVPWVAVNGTHNLTVNLLDTDYVGLPRGSAMACTRANVGGHSRTIQPPASSASLDLSVNPRPRPSVASLDGVGLPFENGSGPALMTLTSVPVVLETLDDAPPASFRLDAGFGPSPWFNASDLDAGTLELLITAAADGEGSDVVSVGGGDGGGSGDGGGEEGGDGGADQEGDGTNRTGGTTRSARGAFLHTVGLSVYDDGTYEVRFQAMDPCGSMGPWTEALELRVNNSPPEPPTVPVSPGDPLNYTYALNATSDRDGWVAYESVSLFRVGTSGLDFPGNWSALEVLSGNPVWSASWTRAGAGENATVLVNDDGAQGTLDVSLLPDSILFSFSDDGSFIFRSLVRDDDGYQREAVTPVLIPNRAPAPTFGVYRGGGLFNGDMVENGTTLRFVAWIGCDPDDDIDVPAGFSWRVDRTGGNGTGGTVDGADGAGASGRDLLGPDVGFTFTEPGNYTVTLTVYDDDGGNGSASWKVTVYNGSAADGTDGDGVPDGDGGSSDGEKGPFAGVGEGDVLTLLAIVALAALTAVLTFFLIMKRRGHVFFWKDYLTDDPKLRLATEGIQVSLAGRIDVIILREVDGDTYRKYELHRYQGKTTPYVGLLWITDRNEEYFLQDAIGGPRESVVEALNDNIDTFVSGEYMISHYGNGTILSPDRRTMERGETGRPEKGELLERAGRDQVERSRRRGNGEAARRAGAVGAGIPEDARRLSREELLRKAVEDRRERQVRLEGSGSAGENEGDPAAGDGGTGTTKGDLLARLK